ncbi:MAG: ParB/RepB/Spo0J family partition protein [Sulfurospirillum sp.]|jgi:ParB family chromosome partitioning protein
MAKKPPAKSSIMDEIREIESSVEKAMTDNFSNVIMVPISDIYEISLASGEQMHNRISYSVTEVKELAGNLKDIEPNGLLGTGLLQPIVLRKNGSRFERISGFRRIEAFKINNALEIPSIVLNNISDATARFMRNSENLKRENINPYDEIYGIIENVALSLSITFKEAISFLNKIKNHNSGKTSFSDYDKQMYISVTDVVRGICKYEVGALIERLVILNMNTLILDALKENELNYSQAKEINKVKDDEIVKKLLYFVKNKNSTVSELREKIKELTQSDPKNNDSFVKKALSKSSFQEKDYKKLDSGNKARADKILKEINDLKIQLEELIQ